MNRKTSKLLEPTQQQQRNFPQREFLGIYYLLVSVNFYEKEAIKAGLEL